MKKTLLLFVAAMATVAAMAQNHGNMNFIGSSTFTASTASQDNLKDTVVVGDGNTSVTLPSMTYHAMGMTLPSIKFVNLQYVMTGSYMTGDMAFTWHKEYADTTITLTDGTQKVLSNVSLTVTYEHTSGELSVDAKFSYGVMPFPLHYVMTGYYTVVPNEWNLVGRGTAGNPYKIYDEADMNSIVAATTAGASAEGKYFYVMNDVEYNGKKYVAATNLDASSVVTGVSEVKAEDAAVQKVVKAVKNGRLVIISNGKMYNQDGQQID